MSERPKEMFRNGRPVVQDFAPTEQLHMRIGTENYDSESNTVAPPTFRFPDQSVNRGGKFGKPEFVLYPNWTSFGIATFLVNDIPVEKNHPQDKAIKYTFVPTHDPLDDNYGHSEIRTWKNGQFSRKTTLPDVLKKELRTEICMRMTVYKPPKFNNE